MPGDESRALPYLAQRKRVGIGAIRRRNARQEERAKVLGRRSKGWSLERTTNHAVDYDQPFVEKRSCNSVNCELILVKVTIKR